jgi:tetratricopeptide (TPR) repeat protein
MKKLPKEGESQKIGRMAARALAPNLPVDWIEKDQDGDTDFGIDYIVQLKSEDSYLHYSFYLQLKGTTVPKYVNNGEFISHPLSVSTLNYYRQQEPCVMVAVVDLSTTDNGLADSPIFYLWLDEEWFKEFEDKLSTNESITVRIPVSQRLSPNLDVFPFYSERAKQRLALLEFHRKIKPHSNDIHKSLELLGDRIEAKPIILKSIEEKNDAPWLHNPDGTVANELKCCSESLCSNKLSVANRILIRLEQDKSSLTKNELAEFYFQRANLFTLEGKYDLAEQQFKLAWETDDKDRYQLSYFESMFKSGVIPSPKELNNIIKQLDIDSYSKCMVKAKCLALLEKSNEAITLMNENYPDKITGQMVVYTISGMVDELDKTISENKDLQFDGERDAFHFNSMAARRYFNKATNGGWLKEEMLPIQGKPNYDLSLMKDAYVFAQKAWLAAKELGYPGDISILLDISFLVYGFFDAISELTEYLESMLSTRPNNPDLLRPYIRVLYNEGEYQRVIELIERLDELDVDDCSLQILSNYNLGKSNKTLELIQEHETLLLSDPKHNIPMLFCISSEIAKEQMNEKLAEKYEGIVKSFEDGEALIAVRKFVTSSNSDVSRRPELIQELYNKYLKLNKSFAIAEQLFRYLNAYEEFTAKQVIELGEQILIKRELTEPDYLHLAQAFMTSSMWEDAENLAEKNISKGINLSKWKLIKAASLQHQGKVGVAYEAIKEVMTNSDVNKDQQTFFVNLCLSLGLFDNVIEVVKELISNTPNKNEKIQLIKILISILSNDTAYSDELGLAINRYGELVDQNDCEQEGQYLLYSLTTSTNDNDEKRIELFRKRLAKYTETFPNSPILKQGFVEPEDGADSIIKSMQKLAGITDEQVKLWEKNKLAIRNGSLPVPFSMLGQFLGDTRDIFTTWVFSLHYPDECLEYRIKHAPQLPKEQFLRELKQVNSVVLEETSLLVLNELDLLDKFLGSLDQFSLVQTVFDNINHSTHQFGGTPYNSVPKKIMATLQKHLNKLVLLNVEGNDPIAIYRQVLSSESVLLLSEDKILLHYLQSENIKFVSGNVFNVIESLDLLGEEQVYLHVSKACGLGIFEPNMRMDILFGAFKHYLDVVNGVDYSTTGFKAIFDKLFEVNRNSDFCLELFFKMLNNTRLNPKTVLSLMQGFLIRHPLRDLSSLIALWLIFKSIQIPLSKSLLIGRSEEHHELWGDYKELLLLDNLNALDSDLLVRNVVRELFNFNEQIREKAYNAIKSCFVPTTHEAELFENIYLEFTLNNKILNLKR